jgi:hypothetical protein
LLYAGPDSIRTGLDALQILGIGKVPTPSGPVHVLIPTDRRRLGAGLVLVEHAQNVSRSRDPDAGGWHQSSARCSTSSADPGTGTRSGPRWPRWCRPDVAPFRSSRELEEGSDRGSAIPGSVLRELAVGVRSVAEAEARALIARSGLPELLWNPRLVDEAGTFVASPDAWFDAVGMA